VSHYSRYTQLRVKRTAFSTAALLVVASSLHAQQVTAVGNPPEKRERRAAAIDTTAAPEAARKPAAVPDTRSMRFDERWDEPQTRGHWSDPLKYIPLNRNGSVWLTVGGQARAREESSRAFQHDPSVNDDHVQSRVSLNADVHIGRGDGPWSRFYGEVRDAQVYHRDLPGGVRTVDADRHDVQNLFAEAGLAKSFVRVGRQEIAFGKERLVGVPDWANTRRGSQGVRAQSEFAGLLVDAASVRPMVIRANARNMPDSTTRLHALQLSKASTTAASSAWVPAQWTLYHYQLDVRGARSQRRLTYGGRSVWKRALSGVGGPQLTVEGEAAIQRGSVGAERLHAWFAVAETQLQWRRAWSAPAILVGSDWASGDRSRNDGRAEAFHSLVPAAHAHGGYADVVGRPNVHEMRIVATADPFGRAALRAAFHRFDRRALTDGVYNKQNALWRAAGDSDVRHIADEIDLTSSFKITRELRLIAGYAWVLPGEFLKEQSTPHTTMRWGFVGTSYTF
jgi:hypothetical protein